MRAGRGIDGITGVMLGATEKWSWSEHDEVFGVTRLGGEPLSVACCPWLVAQRDGLRIHGNPSKI